MKVILANTKVIISFGTWPTLENSWCVICEKSHLCFCHVYHLSKITFMFCHVLWGQTGVSLLIRVCHLLKITFMFCHALWGHMGVSLLIRVCHLSKITFMFCNVLWGQTGVSLLIRVCHLSKITFMFCHVLGGQTRGVTPHWGVSFVKNHICASHVN